MTILGVVLSPQLAAQRSVLWSKALPCGGLTSQEECLMLVACLLGYLRPHKEPPQNSVASVTHLRYPTFSEMLGFGWCRVGSAGPPASRWCSWEAVLHTSLVLHGPVGSRVSSAHGEGRGVRAGGNTSDPSGLHTITPPRSTGQGKFPGRALLPSLVGRIAASWGKGCRWRISTRFMMPPTLPWRLVWWNLLPPPSPRRQWGAWSTPAPPAPCTVLKPCPRAAQDSPSKLLAFSEKICPMSDVFHSIVRSFSKECFF